MPPDDDPATTSRAPEVTVGRVPVLDDARRAEVHDLVAAARAVDGGEPLAEDARLALDGARPGTEVRHLLARRVADPGGSRDGDEADASGAEHGAPALAGYAQVRVRADGAVAGADEVAVELLVAPAERRSGVGTALAQATADLVAGAAAGTAAGVEVDTGAAGRHGEVAAWSHGDHPGAAALARRHGLARQRELWRMERPLDGEDDLPPLDLPDAAALRAFEPGRDEAGWLALNATAFADHPEQGAWGPDDLAARARAPWFDPGDLLLLVDAADPDRLLASHWTKVERAAAATTGEVYVVAVAPAEQGRGLGHVVVLAGLHHLAQRGAGRVELYVEGDNAPARRLYQRLGFSRASTDVAWTRRW